MNPPWMFPVHEGELTAVVGISWSSAHTTFRKRARAGATRQLLALTHPRLGVQEHAVGETVRFAWRGWRDSQPLHKSCNAICITECKKN